MSEFIEIVGGIPLVGEVQISGAKNAALPLLMASLLTPEKITFHRVPNLEDVSLTIHILEHFGAEVHFANGSLTVSTKKLLANEANLSLVKALRASFWVLGPLLARGGAARVALPGGDAIGARPVDIHLEALVKMGADISLRHGVVYAVSPGGLKPADIQFRFPSVGATHQVMMAAALTPGKTTIANAAKEPEIVALGNLLTLMGVGISGLGSELIEIEGREELGGAEFTLIGDRIEAGTYLLAAAATGGSVRCNGIAPEHLGKFLDVLTLLGLEVNSGTDFVGVKRVSEILPLDISTGPFPEVATDLQAPLMALLCLATGTSRIEENIFEGRFGHISELCRMGAKITVQDRIAVVNGVEKLSGAPVNGLDIRAAASLVIAGLAAEGTTRLYDIYHLRRGYEALEVKLCALGARVGCKVLDPDDFTFAGC